MFFYYVSVLLALCTFEFWILHIFQVLMQQSVKYSSLKSGATDIAISVPGVDSDFSSGVTF